MDVVLERLDEQENSEIIVETEDFSMAEPEFIIGRAEDCNLRLPNRFVSRHHCELLVNGRDHVVRVRDLGSQNGTFVNDGPVVDDCELKNGDRLVVGCIPFEVHIGE
jgi:pSer/pThr/pTyr-binding forkhead associated (FHA) protein